MYNSSYSQNFPQGVVARLAGLYGDDRIHLLKSLRAGRAILEEEGQRWLNYLHRRDAVRALIFLCFDQRVTGGFYNVVDDGQLNQLQLYEFLCPKLNLPMPKPGTRAANSKRAYSNKKVVGSKLKALGWSPIVPSLREGLDEILSSEK